jgi:hypothetical protein
MVIPKVRRCIQPSEGSRADYASDVGIFDEKITALGAMGRRYNLSKSSGRSCMPVYDYLCNDCHKTFERSLTLHEHDSQQVVTAFYAVTSKKSAQAKPARVRLTQAGFCSLELQSSVPQPAFVFTSRSRAQTGKRRRASAEVSFTHASHAPLHVECDPRPPP